MFTKSRFALAAFIVAFLTFVPSASSANASPLIPRINPTPSSSSLNPGQSVAVNFALDEPIICPVQDSTCVVTLDFSSSQALGVTASPSSVTWAWADWAQTRTVTFTLDLNTPATYPQAVVMRAVAQSNAEYYRAFRVDVTINLLVPDTRPVSVAVPEQLANTGTNVVAIVWAAVATVTTGAAIFVSNRRRRTSRSGAA